MDQQRRSDVTGCAFTMFAASLSQRPTGAQLGRQRPAQPTFAAQIQCLIDRFVANVPLWTIAV
jgi:hypothetical protein